MTLAVLLVPGAYARVPDALFELDISELANLPVVTASRHEQALWQAPAVMVVLEGEALRRRGYQSLAEALAWVPGFHVIDDGVGQYAVVRGVGGGQRAYGRTLKVMLDGQPLGIRSDATQFLGPELLPLGLVERVEIVRGPASALYGADAYLGVINIITRRDEATRVQFGAGREHKGASAAAEVLATATPAEGEWRVTVAAAQARHDRSGRQLPESSPQPPATAAFSQNDESRPLSFYARVSREQAAQRHSLVLHASERDTDAEFLDFGRLSHANRVALAQQTLSWESAFGEPGQSGSTLWRLAYAWGGPGEDERLSQGVPGSHPARDFGYRSWELAVEQQYRLERHHLVVGVDGSWDHEAPFEVFSVNNVTGDRIQLTPAEDERLFRNVGVYLQSQWQPWQERDWTLSLNWRHDRHNRYENHDSWRAGLTGKLRHGLTGKLLYGTSFKAPNAFQLYGQPLYTGDVLGNPGLMPETARTLEAQLSWQLDSDWLLNLTAYRIEVEQLIELQPFGINQRWSNRGGQQGHGLASELRWIGGGHELALSTTWQDTQVQLEQPLSATVEVPTASAPRLLAMLEWRYRLEQAELGVAGRHVSERRASDSNIDLNLAQVYTLPSYQVVRVHALRELGAHRLGLVLDNVLDTRFEEPGYGGGDLPGAGRRVWLSWSWQP